MEFAKIVLIDNQNLYLDSVIYYTEPIHVKIAGIYGYLTVSNMNVLFFYNDGDSVTYEDMTERFKVVYYTK